MDTTLANINDYLQASLIGDNRVISAICIHTNDVIIPEYTLFAALPGNLSDGHKYIDVAYEKGVRSFLISERKYIDVHSDCSFILVDNVLEALQTIAKQHRSHYDLDVIGITGSNAKTIIKEWLYQLLHDEYSIVKSPKSYNSQIGVPLSLYQIEKYHSLGIFEAGISQSGEMSSLQNMIMPTIGIMTNIGDAHSAGFIDRQQKISEKLTLFASCETIIYCKDHDEIDSIISKTYPDKVLFSWSQSGKEATVSFSDDNTYGNQPSFTIRYKGEEATAVFQYNDVSSLENIKHCITTMLSLGIPLQKIPHKLNQVSGLEMRLEMKEGRHQSIIINDAYSADLSALKVALDFVRSQAPQKEKVLILGKLDQSDRSEKDVLTHVADLCTTYGVGAVHYISPYVGVLPSGFVHYKSKDELLSALSKVDVQHKAILIKGPRKYHLEEVAARLTLKTHSTYVTIDLDALAHNVRTYKSLLDDNTEMIAVIKASAYGSGSHEVAQVLQQNGINRLAVAFVDEAISLRQKGVTLPIVVLNASLSQLRDIIHYDLEIEIYDTDQLREVVRYTRVENQKIAVHLMLDSGMHRLGITTHMLDDLITLLKKEDGVEILSVLSHLAASEDPSHDAYTHEQFSLFESMYQRVSHGLGIQPKRHILNSAGIARWHTKQFEAVRLGLGLYGIDSSHTLSHLLLPVHGLYTSILQIKSLKKGDSVGYNRKTILTRDTKVAILNIGYADGILRSIGNERYSFLLHDKEAAILGAVSMDLIIIDVTDILDVSVGDQITIFDKKLPLEKLSEAAGTIPYEILARISERVKRVYIRS